MSPCGQNADILPNRAEAHKGEKKTFFEDYDRISDYAKAAVDYFCGKNIINGIGDGIFAPLSNLTRAQAAKIIYLLLTI